MGQVASFRSRGTITGGRETTRKCVRQSDSEAGVILGAYVRYAITTWVVPNGRFWTASLVHDSKAGLIYVASGSGDKSGGCLRVYGGIHPSAVTSQRIFHEATLS
jgi:hypothetical protein